MSSEQWNTFYNIGMDDAANGTKDFHFYSRCQPYRRGWDYETHLQSVRREVQDADLMSVA